MIDKDGKIVRTTMKDIRLDEISAVDRPAQPGALMSIMKRAPSKDEEEDSMESEDEGDDSTSKKPKAKTKKVEDGAPDTADTSKSNSGDSHADPVGNVPNEAVMTEKNEKTVDEIAMVAKQLEEVTKRAERAELVSELNDAQRGIFKSLEGEAASSFLALSPEARQAEVAKAAEANAVVYTDAAGAEYRKSDDARLVDMAKAFDKEKLKREEADEKAKKGNLEKRAQELSFLPGTVDVRMSILKGIDALPVAEQGPALEALSAQNADMAKAFERAGTSLVPTTSDPLQSIAKSLRVANPSLSEHEAMAKALETPEGEAAYAKSLGL
tara:strand:- start:19494 stop:20471 length:978 start_codon:yes stop_codon:yes gene_type:complete